MEETRDLLLETRLRTLDKNLDKLNQSTNIERVVKDSQHGIIQMLNKLTEGEKNAYDFSSDAEVTLHMFNNTLRKDTTLKDYLDNK